MGISGEIDEMMDEMDDEDDEDTETRSIQEIVGMHGDHMKKLKSAVNGFLGESNITHVSVIEPSYYGELLTWAVHKYINENEWKIVNTLGYHMPGPIYIDVNTGCGESQNLIRNGCLLIASENEHLVVMIEACHRGRSVAVIAGPACIQAKVHEFADGIQKIIKEKNFYRGGKFEFTGRIRFIDLPGKTLEDIILDPEIKNEIRANTIGFLRNREHLSGLGIPLKRGVLLVGEPGTGKTLLCKALMSEGTGITCIMANAYALGLDEYLTDLYELAQNLTPCIVFIEDIDLIAHNRMEWGYHHGPPLLALLAALDGIEEHRDIVTVATTNYLELLDKAIGQRPSRFDRVIKIPLPSMDQRRDLLSSLGRRISMDSGICEYIAGKTGNLTPAQIQEVVFSLVLENSMNGHNGVNGHFDFSTAQVDRAISALNGRCKNHIGFTPRVSDKNGEP